MKLEKGMKKTGLLGACIAAAVSMLMFTACGSGSPYSGYDLDQYISVGEYTGLYTEDTTEKVTEKDVEKTIAAALDKAQQQKKLEKGMKLKEGDTANIDYVGRVNGKKFEGGSDKGYDLQLGSGTFIDGFESGLVGKKVGDRVKVAVTFPKKYQDSELAGKDAVFTVMVHSATRPEKADYDEAFVKSQGDFKSKKEYEKAVRAELEAQAKEKNIENQKIDLWDQVIAKSKVKKYPQEEVDLYMETNSKQIDAMADEKGVSRNQMLSQAGYPSEQDFEASNEESSKLRVKQELIVMKIAGDEEITFTDDEKDAMIAQFEAQGFTDKTMKAETGRDLEGYVEVQLLYAKVQNFLLENARVE